MAGDRGNGAPILLPRFVCKEHPNVQVLEDRG